LALLGLANLQTSVFAMPENLQCASKALAYLENCGSEDGSWPNCEFIHMDTGRATGTLSQVLSYGSQTVTTAFVLKASLAWNRL
jgi:squalene-hopene/tetraprenyl-beta-curcumene cyclase